jgi:hypothetical protein
MNQVASLQSKSSRIDVYDLEQRLQMAECRYARARASLARFRAEYETLAFTAASVPSVVDAARDRLAAATARCDRARREIAEMELLLDCG